MDSNGLKNVRKMRCWLQVVDNNSGKKQMAVVPKLVFLLSMAIKEQRYLSFNTVFQVKVSLKEELPGQGFCIIFWSKRSSLKGSILAFGGDPWLIQVAQSPVSSTWR